MYLAAPRQDTTAFHARCIVEWSKCVQKTNGSIVLREDGEVNPHSIFFLFRGLMKIDHPL
jgi:hypothetical protein